MAVATKKKKIFDDRYEILSIIGRGSQSVVYQAKNIVEGGPEVALKVLSKKKKDGIPNSERLRKEALAMVSCNHRYVVHLDDFHTVGDVSYLSMELAQEGDLRRYIKKMGGRLSPAVIKRFFTQTLEAIDYIHKVGIIHRDIKPDNILVLNEQEIRLGDFGIAILPGETPVSEDTQLGVGTMDYLSPEILEGKQFNILSDLYSLGICFYEVITAKTPFADVPLMKQLEARKNYNLKSLSNIRTDLPPHLINIILKMLQFNPADRFQTAGDILKALQAGDNSPPINAVSTASQKEKPSISKTTAKKSQKQDLPKSAIKTPTANAALASSPTTPNDRPVSSTVAAHAKTTDNDTDASCLAVPEDNKSHSKVQKPKSLLAAEKNTAQEKLKEPAEEVIMMQKKSENFAQNTEHFASNTSSKTRGDASNRDFPVKKTRAKVNPNLFKLVFIGIAILCAVILLRRAINRSESPSNEATRPQIELSAAQSFADAIIGHSFDFTRIKPGIYTGMLGAVLPGQQVPLSIIVNDNSRHITVIAGIEGWMPQIISLDSERLLEKPNALRVASNGFVIELLATGEITAKLVQGEVKNIITGERGTWLLMPQV